MSILSKLPRFISSLFQSAEEVEPPSAQTPSPVPGPAPKGDPERIIDGIIEREGGYVNHPADRGGPTKYGITQTRLSEWRGGPVSARDVEALDIEEAREIYRVEYIKGPRFNEIEDGLLQELVVDCGVNHGHFRAAQWLQQAAGVDDDGIVGPITLNAVNSENSGTLYRRVLATRARFFGRIITNRHSQAVFAAGWLDHRVAAFIERCP